MSFSISRTPPVFICFELVRVLCSPRYCALEAPHFGITMIAHDNAKGSAPLKLPATHCPNQIFSDWLETTKLKGAISLATPRYPKARFKVSHLYYALIQQPQYEATVKLLGSFRLTAGTRHLYRDCIFTEQVLETVSHSLRHSCTSELTRQGNTLYIPYSLAQ